MLLLNMKKIILLFILIPSISIADSMHVIGEKGNPADVVKVIKVKMFDNYYEPNEFKIKKTIRSLALLLM